MHFQAFPFIINWRQGRGPGSRWSFSPRVWPFIVSELKINFNLSFKQAYCRILIVHELKLNLSLGFKQDLDWLLEGLLQLKSVLTYSYQTTGCWDGWVVVGGGGGKWCEVITKRVQPSQYSYEFISLRALYFWSITLDNPELASTSWQGYHFYLVKQFCDGVSEWLTDQGNDQDKIQVTSNELINIMLCSTQTIPN